MKTVETHAFRTFSAAIVPAAGHTTQSWTILPIVPALPGTLGAFEMMNIVLVQHVISYINANAFTIDRAQKALKCLLSFDRQR